MTKEEIEARLREIDTAIEDMRENLSGCDWCCGGGDEAMWDLGDKRRKLTKLLKAQTIEEQ